MTSIKRFLLTSEHPELESCRRLLEESSKLGLITETINPYDQILAILPNQNDDFRNTLVFHRTTGIRNEDFDLDLAKSYLARGGHIVNTPQAFSLLRDKERQAVFCQEHHIPCIPTLSLRKRPSEKDFEFIFESLKPFLSPRNPNFILKTLRGNQGIGVNLINGHASLKGILETLWAIQDQKFLIQPYIERTREMRLLCSHGRIIGSIERFPSLDEFRANADRGDSKKLHKDSIPKAVLDIISTLHQHSQAHHFALDIIEQDGRIFLIEINLVPGFKQMEHMTGTNIAAILIHDAIE